MLGGGGYVAGPMVVAAWLARIPAALTEADAHLGLANRLAAPFARRVFLSFPIEGREDGKYRVTGRPIPARRASRRADGGATDVRAAGGGAGAARVRRQPGCARAERARRRGVRRGGAAVLHLSGERDYESLRLGVRRHGYRLVPFTDDFGAALGAADLALARAGGSVWELAAAGLPAVLVPGLTSRPATIRRRTPATSSAAVAPWSCRRRSSTPSPTWCARCFRTRAAHLDEGGDARAGPAGRCRTRSPRSCASRSPLAGRRIWFAGIGGAGLSAYALLAHAWRADVSGWDRVDTPYLTRSRRRHPESCLGPPARAARRLGGCRLHRVRRSRVRPLAADFLAELVSLQRAIVVAGAHGKTTTAAMIAFCLDRLGLDPAWLIGAEVPQLGGNARAGRGWLVVEGDESDRTVAALVARDRRASPTSTSTTTPPSPRAPSSRRCSRSGSRACPGSCAASRCHRFAGRSAWPASTTAATPRARSRRSSSPAWPRRMRRVLAEFRGAGRRLERRGERRGVTV